MLQKFNINKIHTKWQHIKYQERFRILELKKENTIHSPKTYLDLFLKE